MPSLEIQKITAELRDPVQAIRRACGHESASHSFASLFLWQEDMDLSICLRKDAYAVRCGHWGEGYWYFPCGNDHARLQLLTDIVDSSPDTHLLYLRKDDVEFLNDRFPGRFRIEPADDASEYLYDRKEYTEMSGSKYEHIRWCINHLKNHYSVKTEILTPGNIEVAKKMLAVWAPCSETDYFSNDHTTAKLMLNNLEALEMTGIIVYLNGEAAAFAAGFPLSDSVYDIAFSKALERERGVQFFVRRALIEQLPAQYRIINGEEDLGIPGLRQSKLQENPIGRIEMFSAHTR